MKDKTLRHANSNVYKKATRLIELLLESGASDAFFVGGTVRDQLLGTDVKGVKDIDIEVYGLSYEQIAAILKQRFHVNFVGKSFGVIKVDNAIDVGVPRRESKQGSGHRGFEVVPDPTMTIREAFARRDFTINAIGLRLSGEFIDPFGGRDDLKNGILRATTDAFCEDPLRVLRGMQFAARFGFKMDSKTIDLCKRVANEFDTLAPERIWDEWQKWATLGKKPSRGLDVLCDTGWLEKFPEIAALINTPQNPKYHPEGDVFAHTRMVVDAAACIADEEQLDNNDRIILLLSALAHDFGKPCTLIRKKNGHWSSPEHARHSGQLAATFLHRMRPPLWVIENVVPLVTEHMAHKVVPDGEQPTDRIVRRLAARLEPANIRMWVMLCNSDARGCGGANLMSRHPSTWKEIAERLTVLDARPQPLLQGRDLIALGMSPSPAMGTILKEAYDSQLDGVFTTHEEAIEYVKDKLGEL